MKTLALIIITLTSCSTRVTRDSGGRVKVSAGAFSPPTTVTAYPDGKVTVQTTPQSPLEAALSGLTGGLAKAFLNGNRHDQTTAR